MNDGEGRFSMRLPVKPVNPIASNAAGSYRLDPLRWHCEQPESLARYLGGRLRVLSIVPFPVLPLSHGGRVRAYRLAVGLAHAGATVHLACPWHPSLPFRPFIRDDITIRPFRLVAGVLPAILGDRLVPPLMQLSLQPFTWGPRRLLRQCADYDLVEFHFCAYASWMKRLTTVTRVVYSAHNVELDYARSISPNRLSGMVARRIGTLEREAVRASDLVVACTEADGRRLAELYGEPSRLAVVPNGFEEADIEDMQRVPREEARQALGLMPEELVILFVGGRALHNRRAVQFLEHELLPALTRPARLLIAGQCASKRREGRVVALGFVERLAPLLAAADLAVNPVTSGSGSNIKLPEYVAAGLPVVTTPLGLRGYEAFAHLVTVAELDRFAGAIRDLPRQSRRLPAVSHLGWSALGRRLHETYAASVARARGPD